MKLHKINNNSLSERPISLINGHFETIFNHYFSEDIQLNYRRETISTSDGDFLDLDFIDHSSSDVCTILLHGLESSANAKYIKRTGKFLNNLGHNICAVNYRGCSGRVNHKLRYYHSGATDDIKDVVDFVSKKYSKIYLIGFSLGANLTLKYLGDYNCKRISKAFAFSAPCDLSDSANALRSGFSNVYGKNFLKTLKDKVLWKKDLLLESGIDPNQIYKIKTLYEFDNVFTAPVHGFKNAEDYYKKCSSKYVLNQIQVPTFIFNAEDDPFLQGDCYPLEFIDNPLVTLDITKKGGHVSFRTKGGGSWINYAISKNL